jgi:ubiquinone/menaquinone biosynthesis C-methylase UbiE
MNYLSNKRAESFDNCPWFTDELFGHWILEHISKIGSSIGDIGAGTGFMANMYKDIFDDVIAFEPSIGMYLKLREKFIDSPNVQTINQGIENIKMDANSIDILISKSSLHHFSDINLSLSNMTQIARNAIAVIEVIVPDEVCIPFLKEILLRKEKERSFNTIFKQSDLISYISESSKDVRSLIYDQYIIVDRWLNNSDLTFHEQSEILKIIASQKGLIKEKMQIHKFREEWYMLRRMNLVIGIL